MGKKVRILIVCGCGAGSSLMLRGNVSNVLAKYKLKADLEVADMLTAPSLKSDILLCAPDVLKGIKKTDNFREIITINNFMSEKEIEDKLIPKIKELI